MIMRPARRVLVFRRIGQLSLAPTPKLCKAAARPRPRELLLESLDLLVLGLVAILLGRHGLDQSLDLFHSARKL